jgi:hypothetical protein
VFEGGFREIAGVKALLNIVPSILRACRHAGKLVAHGVESFTAIIL